MSDSETTTYRGVRWRRQPAGEVAFYDQSADRWVTWAPEVDAPPLPPRWGLLGVATRVTRPGWRSHWRIIPIVLVVAAVAAAIGQVLLPSSKPPASGYIGKCLEQSGSVSGHASYTTVSCGSPKSTLKVVEVLRSNNDSCPAGTELLIAGIDQPTGLCVRPLKRS